MSGVSFEVHWPIFLIPPRMTRAVSAAMIAPMSQSLSAKKLESPPVAWTRIAAAWFAWKRLPAPMTPSTAVRA